MAMKTIEFNITPFAKPRMTRADRWKKRPVVLNYFKWKEEMQWIAKSNKFKLPSKYEAIFYMPMPKSWGDKKRKEMKHKPHQQRPDKDNLEKALNDALCEEDSHIWDSRTKKIWSVRPSIVIKYN